MNPVPANISLCKIKLLVAGFYLPGNYWSREESNYAGTLWALLTNIINSEYIEVELFMVEDLSLPLSLSPTDPILSDHLLQISR